MNRVRVRIIESDRGAFEMRYRRGRKIRPGVYRWNILLRQLSGAPLLGDEWQALGTRAVVELVSLGVDVVSWGGAFGPG